jgi:uncharacterized lipoprotein YddW (UPF0748 family)
VDYVESVVSIIFCFYKKKLEMVLLLRPMKYWLLGVWICMMSSIAGAQTTAKNKNNKYEFRGVWIATIGNIDWPSVATRNNPSAQQQEFISLLNTMQYNGLNAVILQVRPCADAFYNSSYEGWSRYTSGKEGLHPGYDPLSFAIAECHKRGMELHAWFNPYRSLVDANKNIHPANHASRLHPEWMIRYAGKQYFNPGIPAVRNYLEDVVSEVVKNYDIDAVHFDDYFYPYKEKGMAFPDEQTYKQYGAAFANKDDWRRDNVNKLIQELHVKIKAIKPTMKLGISPFGVYRNYTTDPSGSYTNGGVQNYDDLYADILLWQKNGWIDYVLPQLYWERGHKAAAYDILLEWWARNSFNRAFYAGLGLYQEGVNKAAAWKQGTEIPNQIVDLRAENKCNGFAMYSANGFYKNKNNVIGNLKNYCLQNKAIVPSMKWLDSIAPTLPIVKKTRNKEGEYFELKHNSNDANCFVIYKFEKNEKIDIENATKIFSVQGDGIFYKPVGASQSVFVVTSLDRTKNESNYTIIE